jgi:pimeloyl-ACP methyl ester carboxylesterase
VALAAASRPATSLAALVVYESPVAAVGPIDPFPRKPEEGPADLAERFMRVMVGESVWSRLPERTRADRRAEGPALVADLESSVDGGALVDPASITIPVVVGVGERSRPAGRDRARALAHALPAATSVTVPGAGHGVHLTHPTATADLVLAALRSLDLRGDEDEGTISSG